VHIVPWNGMQSSGAQANLSPTLMLNASFGSALPAAAG
jgi:hypothetical protein